MERLADQGHTQDKGVTYARGRIVLFTSAAARIDPDWAALRAAVANGRLRHFAIPNPEHAPYGRAAEQVLRGQGLWEAIKPKLVFGENISQAAQFAASGSAQGGIFAYSLALAPAIGALGSYVLIRSEWHAPLRQRMVLLKNADETAKSFYVYLQTPAARAVLRKYGFLLPGEAV